MVSTAFEGGNGHISCCFLEKTPISTPENEVKAVNFRCFYLKAYHRPPFDPGEVGPLCSGSAGSSVRRPRSRLSVICTACSQLSRVIVSCALTVSESLIKIDDAALEHCCSLGGPGARRGWRERRSEVVMYDSV